MKRILILLLVTLLSAGPCLAENTAMPEWEYPLAPEILENKAGYITLVDRNHLLASNYEPDDLVVISLRCVSSIRGDKLRKTAHTAMKRMFEAAEADEIGRAHV